MFQLSSTILSDLIPGLTHALFIPRRGAILIASTPGSPGIQKVPHENHSWKSSTSMYDTSDVPFEVLGLKKSIATTSLIVSNR